jgi:hypothetical protein
MTGIFRNTFLIRNGFSQLIRYCFLSIPFRKPSDAVEFRQFPPLSRMSLCTIVSVFWAGGDFGWTANAGWLTDLFIWKSREQCRLAEGDDVKKLRKGSKKDKARPTVPILNGRASAKPGNCLLIRSSQQGQASRLTQRGGTHFPFRRDSRFLRARTECSLLLR